MLIETVSKYSLFQNSRSVNNQKITKTNRRVMRPVLKVLPFLCFLLIILTCCTPKTNRGNKTSKLSDIDLIAIRDGFDKRVAAVFDAQKGKLAGDKKYFDDAVKQVKQFSDRMFNHQKGLYTHGWVQAMDVHPEYHWARANGWAVMAMVELLDVLPKDHPGYIEVADQLREHIKGLASYQDGTGFWHQLIDRNDTYLETSATAIYTYAIACAINLGLIDKLAYGPVAILRWNAVSTKVNSKGQVEGTCVGTGMAFDPAFYYHRPINSFAAHAYGPVILAGAEIITLLNNYDFEINDSSLQLKVTSN